MLVPNKNLDGRSHVAFQLNRLMALLVLMMLGWSHQWTRHPETNLQTGCLQFLEESSSFFLQRFAHPLPKPSP